METVVKQKNEASKWDKREGGCVCLCVCMCVWGEVQFSQMTYE